MSKLVHIMKSIAGPRYAFILKSRPEDGLRLGLWVRGVGLYVSMTAHCFCCYSFYKIHVILCSRNVYDLNYFGICGFPVYCFVIIVLTLQDFDELLCIAEQGDHRNIDMLVGDIYGGNYTAYGLPADLIASSFGKAARSTRCDSGIFCHCGSY